MAIRCPAHPIANAIIKASSVAIAAPSANLSGSPSPTEGIHVINDLNGRIEAIVDGGSAEIGLESTIVKIESDSTLTLLRPGQITVNDLCKTGLTVNVADAVKNKLGEGEKVLSPGMKYRHYAPKAPLMLLDGEVDQAIGYIKENAKGKTAVICYDEDKGIIKAELPSVCCYSFGKKSDELSQAHVLFSLLREVDKLSYDVIFAPLPSAEGVGLALYNRMIRAAAHTIIKLR